MQEPRAGVESEFISSWTGATLHLYSRLQEPRPIIGPGVLVFGSFPESCPLDLFQLSATNLLNNSNSRCICVWGARGKSQYPSVFLRQSPPSLYLFYLLIDMVSH